MNIESIGPLTPPPAPVTRSDPAVRTGPKESLPPVQETLPANLTSLVRKLHEMPEIRPEVVAEARQKLSGTGLLTDDAVTAILGGLPELRE